MDAHQKMAQGARAIAEELVELAEKLSEDNPYSGWKLRWAKSRMLVDGGRVAARWREAGQLPDTEERVDQGLALADAVESLAAEVRRGTRTVKQADRVTALLDAFVASRRKFHRTVRPN